MASAEFDNDSEEKRPTVQVGDPFTEKLLIEACLELMATDAIVAIQDMGAAGLTSSSVEMSSKGEVGIELNIDQIPAREEAMTTYEIMLSESQERMLMVLKPGAEDAARKIFEKWGLDFAIIGRVTEGERLVLKENGTVVADIPVPPLVSEAPEYDRPRSTPPAPDAMPEVIPAIDTPIADSLLKLLGSPNLCSKRWIWEQYDHMVMGDTTQRPGGDAAVVRIHDTNKGLAMTSDCTPRYCFADPGEGGKQTVAEAWRNLTAVGARPLAVTDNLNFGNPERPEIMAQIAGCVMGMAEACEALDFPVVSGNVSLYNETNGSAILPTPVIGGVGVIDDLTKMVTMAFPAEGQTIILIGDTEGHLGASLWLREVAGLEAGSPPPVDLGQERQNGDLVRSLITDGTISACHDLSGGGLLVALAGMALAGNTGCEVSLPDSLSTTSASMFGEDQARYLLTTSNPDTVLSRTKEANVSAVALGTTGGTTLTVGGLPPISLEAMRDVHEGWLPDYMAVS
jgi:phosphoribosylformylglycinamidine synthase II